MAGKAAFFAVIANEHYLTETELLCDIYEEKIGPVIIEFVDIGKIERNIDCVNRAKGSQNVFKITEAMWNELAKDESAMQMLELWRKKYKQLLYKSTKADIRGIPMHAPFIAAVLAGSKTIENRNNRLIKTFQGSMNSSQKIICRWCSQSATVTEKDTKLKLCTGHKK